MDGPPLDFEDWYRDAYQSVVASLVLAAGSIDVGRELTDEAFTRALERWPSVRTMSSPTGWVYTVAMNLLRSRARRALVERRAAARLDRRADAPPDTLAVEVWDAARQLPPRQREAIALRYVGGLTEADVANAMGLAPGTVARLLHDARRALAPLLTDEVAR